MKQNINFSGRVLRGILALILLGLAYWQSSWILLAASLFVFFEAYASWCVVYHFLGINSCPVKKKKS